MKLWRARLDLYYNDDLEIVSLFRFEQTEEEYKILDENRWIKAKSSYLNSTLSREKDLRKHYGNYIVEQGFDKELNKTEQGKVEEDMKNFLIDIIKSEMEREMEMYNKKLKVLKH